MNVHDPSPPGDLNRTILRGFGPLLVVVGLLGFLVPPKRSVTSGAPAYNLFHLAFGAVGIGCAARGRVAARAFNLGFGVLDLYQAAANHRGLFPKRWFRWKPADDVLHVAVGGALVAAALSGRSAPRNGIR